MDKTDKISVMVRMDKKDKEDLEEILSSMGLKISVAFSIFAKAMIQNKGFPFPVSTTFKEETDN